MDLTGLFQQTLYVVTKPIRAGSTATAEWLYSGLEESMIEATKGNCGCTKPKIEKDKVSIVYTDSHKSKDIDGATVVSKSVTIYLRDGEPLKVTNAKGVEDWNIDKASVTLMFHVSVIP